MRRLVLGVIVAAVVVGLIRVDGAPTGYPDEDGVQFPAVGRTGDGSVWYCAAGSSGDLAHTLVITNLGSKGLRARVTGFGATPMSPPPALAISVSAGSNAVVPVTDIGPDVAGVVVELAGGVGSVEHRLSSPDAVDTERCSPSTSPNWYFPAADSELGASARLWLLNPFPTDASLDVTVATEDGVRIPTALRGVVVPGGSSRVIELGESVQRRAQFAVAVRARAGRVVAELAQTGDGEGGGEGLWLQGGVANPASRWYFADGFGGPSVSERYIVFNPDASPVQVEVAVMTGADPSLVPEPFVLDVAARRFTIVDLDKEPRVPETGPRWVRITGSDGARLVAQRIVSVLGPGGDGSASDRPTVADGLATSSGSAEIAGEWVVGDLVAASEGRSVIVVVNPSSEAIAVVQMLTIAGGAEEVLGSPLEVAPGAGLAIDLSESPALAAGGPVIVRASSPIVVESRVTSTARKDLWIVTALPVARSIGRSGIASTDDRPGG